MKRAYYLSVTFEQLIEFIGARKCSRKSNLCEATRSLVVKSWHMKTQWRTSSSAKAQIVSKYSVGSIYKNLPFHVSL